MNGQEESALRTLKGTLLKSTIESFLLDRKAGGLAKRSISFYALNLKQFASYCEERNIQDVGELTADFLREYILFLQDRHNSGGVLAAFRSLHCFLNWLAEEDVMPGGWKNPIAKIHAPKNNLPPLTPVSFEEVNKLLENANSRDACIFLFLLDSGLRASELCALNIEDVDFSMGAVAVRSGKGGKQRVVYIGKRVKRALRAYLRTRKDNSPALFATTDGYRLTYSGLHSLLWRRMEDCNLKGIQLHGFRRAFCLQMLRGGADVFALQRLTGHTSLGILKRYIAMDDEDSRIQHEKASPVDSL